MNKKTEKPDDLKEQKRQRDLDLLSERRAKKEIQRQRTIKYSERVKDRYNDELMWWKLDNAAVIYPSGSSANWPAVYRLSATLKEEVKPQSLQEAVDTIMPRFPYFNVRLKRGLFWYYFEEQPCPPLVIKEVNYPCRQFDLNSKKHIIRVMYYNKKIVFEAFHSLCDGKGALKFFNALLMRYFEICGEKFEYNEKHINYLDAHKPGEFEDAFIKNADLKEVASRTSKSAYQIKGTPLELGQNYIYSILMNVSDIKVAAKLHSASLTEYLLAAIMQACNEQRKQLKVLNRPIGVQLPIDIRRFYPSDTLRNFMTMRYITLPVDYEGDFAETILLLRDELAKITKDSVMKSVNMNVKVQTNRLVRLVPLFIKNPLLKLSSFLFGDRYCSTIFSNVGPIDTPKEFNELIDYYECMMGQSRFNKFSIACSTFNNKLVMCINSKIVESDLIGDIIKVFTTDNVKVEVISNKPN